MKQIVNNLQNTGKPIQKVQGVFGALKDIKPAEERTSKANNSIEGIITKDAKLTAELIDKGASYSKIKRSLSDEHSGATFAGTIAGGISLAKNKEHAKKIQAEHNKACGFPEVESGTVNPAMLTATRKH